jgi:hypothetical protein
MSRDVHSCTHWLRSPQLPTFPLHLDLYYEGAIGQPRYTTSLCNGKNCVVRSEIENAARDSRNLADELADMLARLESEDAK